MKPSFLLAAIALSSLGIAQDPQTGSPAGGTSTTRMIDMAVSKAKSALQAGKKVTITVDNRTVAFAPRLMGRMVYVPVRFFSEAGLKIVWDKSDMRATVTDENGTQKNSVEYDASVSQKNQRSGPSMRPMYQKGVLYVPLASGLASFSLLAEWVPTSTRLNVRTNRGG